MPKFCRSHWLFVAGLIFAVSGLALSGCEDEEIGSNLNTEGNPRVVMVSVITESEVANGGSGKFLPEAATFCSTSDDDKLNPTYCDGAASKVTDAVAVGVVPLPNGANDWYVRIVFNELLDADRVETLIPCNDRNHNGECDSGEEQDNTYGSLAATQPANLKCAGAEIQYDGWYDPQGNHLTDPPGPALIVQALEYVSTLSDCELTLKSDVVRDKDQNQIDSSPVFEFSLTPFGIRTASAPADKPVKEHCVDEAFTVSFTGLLDASTIADKVTLLEQPGDTVVPFKASASVNNVLVKLVDPIDASKEIDFKPETLYSLKIDSGIAETVGGGEFTGTFDTFFETGEIGDPGCG
ncbi:MAG: hypothetical protein MJE77_45520 [Proteobacteria bacterium]|nr:hypothetical protein [Pseudomonadota bacterium]